jgi:hypothetical protein
MLDPDCAAKSVDELAALVCQTERDLVAHASLFALSLDMARVVVHRARSMVSSDVERALQDYYEQCGGEDSGFLILPSAERISYPADSWWDEQAQSSISSHFIPALV